MKFYDEIKTDSERLHRFSWLLGPVGMEPSSRYDLLKNFAEMFEEGKTLGT